MSDVIEDPALVAGQQTIGCRFRGALTISAKLSDLPKLEDWIRTSVLTRVKPGDVLTITVCVDYVS